MDLHFKSAAEIAGLIRNRKVGAAEVLDRFLTRIEKYNPRLNAIIWRDVERARQRARAADAALAKGETWGPLHGVPMTIKESYDIVGLPTTWGAPEFKAFRPERNAIAVDRFLRAGAVIFGKTNVPYMLGDFQSYNVIYGTTNNPWDVKRSPGGSSGGAAAALAAGLTGLEAGSDIGSSLRNPAHYCGIYAHKPTFGLISTRGHAPPGIMTPTDISVVGPMARAAEDLELALRALAAPDVLQQAAWRIELPPPRYRRLRDFRVAVWASSPLCRIDASVSDVFECAIDAILRAGTVVDDTV